MNRPKWFAARMILEAVHPEEPPGDRLYEDRVILVKADDEHQARLRAGRLGEASRQHYKNEYGGTVVWQFKELLDVVELFDETIADGTEVYYSLIGEVGLGHIRSLFRWKTGEQPAAPEG